MILATQVLCVMVLGYLCRNEAVLSPELRNLFSILVSPVALIGFPLLGVAAITLSERRGKDVLYLIIAEAALLGTFLLALLPAVQ